jgi:hypothetical protein
MFHVRLQQFRVLFSYSIVIASAHGSEKYCFPGYARYYQVYPGYDCYGNPWDLWKSDIGFIYATFQQASDACDNLVNCVGFRSSSGIGGPWWLLNTMTITDVGGPEYLCFLRTPQTMQIKQSVMNKDASWVCPLGTSTCNFNQMAGTSIH